MTTPENIKIAEEAGIRLSMFHTVEDYHDVINRFCYELKQRDQFAIDFALYVQSIRAADNALSKETTTAILSDPLTTRELLKQFKKLEK